MTWTALYQSSNITNNNITNVTNNNQVNALPYNYDSYVYLIGRWFKRYIGGIETYTTLNLGSEIRFIVDRTATVSMKFYPLLDASTHPYIVYSIDGGAFQRVQVSTGVAGQQVTVQIASGLSTTTSHTVRVIASGFQSTDQNWNKGLALNYQGVQVDAGGYVYPWINNQKKILFLGDSITTGIHITNTQISVAEMAHGELAYPTVCCGLLNDTQVWKQAFGFTGLSHTGDGGEPISPTNVKYFMNNVPFINENPDVIVVNIGTNDRGMSSSAFQTAYDSYISGLQSLYPNKPIFCMLPFANAFSGEIQAVCTKYSCNYVNTVGWVTTFTDGTHPDTAGHQTAGTNLSNVLNTVLGDSFFN